MELDDVIIITLLGTMWCYSYGEEKYKVIFLNPLITLPLTLYMIHSKKKSSFYFYCFLSVSFYFMKDFMSRESPFYSKAMDVIRVNNKDSKLITAKSRPELDFMMCSCYIYLFPAVYALYTKQYLYGFSLIGNSLSALMYHRKYESSHYNLDNIFATLTMVLAAVTVWIAAPPGIFGSYLSYSVEVPVTNNANANAIGNGNEYEYQIMGGNEYFCSCKPCLPYFLFLAAGVPFAGYVLRNTGDNAHIFYTINKDKNSSNSNSNTVLSMLPKPLIDDVNQVDENVLKFLPIKPFVRFLLGMVGHWNTKFVLNPPKQQDNDNGSNGDNKIVSSSSPLRSTSRIRGGGRSLTVSPSRSRSKSKTKSKKESTSTPKSTPGTSKERHYFSDEEIDAILSGVDKYGIGKWNMIKNDSEFATILINRTSVNIKDKYRTLVKQGLAEKTLPKKVNSPSSVKQTQSYSTGRSKSPVRSSTNYNDQYTHEYTHTHDTPTTVWASELPEQSVLSILAGCCSCQRTQNPLYEILHPWWHIVSTIGPFCAIYYATEYCDCGDDITIQYDVGNKWIFGGVFGILQLPVIATSAMFFATLYLYWLNHIGIKPPV
jgi:hypothetical protein